MRPGQNTRIHRRREPKLCRTRLACKEKLSERQERVTQFECPNKDKNGKLLIAQEEQNIRWAEHFQETLNQLEPTTIYNFEVENAQEELVVTTNKITIQEVKIAIKNLKNNKAASRDKIPAELLKHHDQTMAEAQTTLFNKCWRRGTVPEDWRKGAIVKLLKKGNSSECTNWRGITLLSVPGKEFCIILLGRL
uniref:Reverse transcriptase domain-containing protein n=1 Tax=Romanomermis culicivorax TaxID=13658 RepID=A0A915J4E2_ROMCU